MEANGLVSANQKTELCIWKFYISFSLGFFPCRPNLPIDISFSFWAGRVLQYTFKIKGKFVLIYEREAFSGLVTDKGSSFLGLFLKGMR